MSTKLHWLVGLLLFPLALATEPVGGVWHDELEPARALAQRTGTDLLIDFGGSDWCAPCKWLKQRIFSQPAFLERAAPVFVLVEIDDLRRTKMPDGRKERYKALQQHYGIETFPSVVLATPDGLPYARTTYLESITTPDAYWAHLQPLRERGGVLRAALTRAATLQGAAKAAALVEGLSVVPAGFVARFYGEQLAELRRLDPEDRTGYLAFLAGRKVVDDLHARLAGKGGGLKAVPATEIDGLIGNGKIRGEALQELHVLRALLHLDASEVPQALGSFRAMVAASRTVTRYDLGDLRPLNAADARAIEEQIEVGLNPATNPVAVIDAVHRITEEELPDPFEISCGHGFRAGWMARPLIPRLRQAAGGEPNPPRRPRPAPATKS